MKWLRVHAHYDDTHPWEALEIVAMLTGQRPQRRDVAIIESAITKSYEYLRTAFDDCLAGEAKIPAPLKSGRLSAAPSRLMAPSRGIARLSS